jgi:hypothetical protein
MNQLPAIIIGYIFQWISLVSASIIIVQFAIQPNKRTVSMHLVFLLTIPDLIFLLTNIVCYTVRLSNTGFVRYQKEDALCMLVGSLEIMGQQAVLLQGLVYIYALFGNIFK